MKTHLKLYKLRSKVKIKDATSTYDVLVSGVQDPWQAAVEDGGGGEAPEKAAGETGAGAGGRAARFADPRCAALGVRVIRPKGEAGSRARFALRRRGFLEWSWALGFFFVFFLSFLVLDFFFSKQGKAAMPRTLLWATAEGAADPRVF